MSLPKREPTQEEIDAAQNEADINALEAIVRQNPERVVAMQLHAQLRLAAAVEDLVEILDSEDKDEEF